MNIKEESSSKIDNLKLIGALAVFSSSIFAFYSFPDISALIRVGGILASVIVAVFIALQTDKGRNVWVFAQEARTEVRKVVWPTRAETMQTTLIVIVMVIIVAIMLWIIDSTLFWAVGFITGLGD